MGKQNFEVVITGWENIALMFGKTDRAMITRRDELLDAGVIFYSYFGRPPRRMVAAFPSMLKRWACLKSSVAREEI